MDNGQVLTETLYQIIQLTSNYEKLQTWFGEFIQSGVIRARSPVLYQALRYHLDDKQLELNRALMAPGWMNSPNEVLAFVAVEGQPNYLVKGFSKNLPIIQVVGVAESYSESPQ